MSIVLVELLDADPELNRSLARHISANGIDIVQTEAGITASAASFEECDRLGAAIAEFIKASTGEFQLHLDGRGGESFVHHPRLDGDAETISSLLATCAFLK